MTPARMLITERPTRGRMGPPNQNHLRLTGDEAHRCPIRVITTITRDGSAHLPARLSQFHPAGIRRPAIKFRNAPAASRPRGLDRLWWRGRLPHLEREHLGR